MKVSQCLSHIVFLFIPQTATDSSSNSSQRREPVMHTLAPAHFCEPRRHHCILGHFYEQHQPSDHHFLSQVSHVSSRCDC